MTILQRMRLRSKLMLLVAVFCVGMILLSILFFSALNAVRVNGDLYKRIVQGKDLIADILPPPEYVIESYLVVLQMSETSDSAEREALAQQLQKLKADYEDRHAFWIKDLPDDAMKTAMVEEAYRPAMEFYRLAETQYLPALKKGDAKTAADALVAMKKPYLEHRAAIDKVVKAATDRNTEDEANGQKLIRDYVIGLLAGVLLLLIADILYAIRLSRAISRPIAYATAAMREIASGDGDLRARLTADSQDEMAELAHNFNIFVEKVQTSVGSVQTNVHELIATAESLRDVSRRLSDRSGSMDRKSAVAAQGVERIQGSVSRVVSIGDDMGTHVSDLNVISRDMSGHVNQVAGAMDGVLGSLQDIGQQCVQSVGVSRQAESALTQVEEVTRRLEQTATQVGKIVDLISNVADKTNLLALNATIEAANAGEAGRGFAIVAQEVKTLARQTAKATDDIRQQVSALQTASGESLSAMQAYAGVVGRLGDINNTIANAVETQISAMDDVAHSITQTASGVQELASRVDTLHHTIEGDFTESVHEAAAGLDAVTDSLLGLGSEIQNVLATASDVQQASSSSSFASEHLEAVTRQFRV